MLHHWIWRGLWVDCRFAMRSRAKQGQQQSGFRIAHGIAAKSGAADLHRTDFRAKLTKLRALPHLTFAQLGALPSKEGISDDEKG